MQERTFMEDLEEFKKNNYFKMIPEKLKVDQQTMKVVQFPTFLFASSKKMIRRL